MSDKVRHGLDIGASWIGTLGTITLTQVSTLFAILAGAATFGFTVHRWIYWHRNHKKNDD